MGGRQRDQQKEKRLGVDDAAKVSPPIGLSYPQVASSYTVGDAVYLRPVFESGEEARFMVQPALPKGLLLDTRTGVIKGTLIVGAPESTYTVSAKNKSGECETTFTFS